MASLTWVENALAQPCSGRPRDRRGWFLDGGLFDGEGRLVAAGHHRGERSLRAAPPTLSRPDLPATPGSWLFGGWLQRHFGHLVVSLGRLWAVPELAREVQGVVFLRLPDNRFHEPGRGPLQVPMVADLLACLGVGGASPAHLVAAPTRFARLAVPEQIVLGHRETSAEDNARYVAMLRRMAASPLVPQGAGARRIYVSRRRLGPAYGRYLFEEVLERNLESEGYAILHPELLTIPQQIAAYAGAEAAIFAESSAIHLAVGLLQADRPAAIIARRSPPADSILSHLHAAGMHRATVIDAVRGAGVALEDGAITASSTFAALSILDFDLVRERLVEAGLCRGIGWQMPSEGETAEAVAAAIARRRGSLPEREVRFVPAEALARRQPVS